MRIKKFESHSVEKEDLIYKKEIKSISDITDEMIEAYLTEDEFLKKEEGNKYDDATLYTLRRLKEKMEEVRKEVKKTFLDSLNSSLGENDRKFLKKAVKFLQENKK